MSIHPRNWKKSLLFAILGALGCVVAALPAEALLAWAMPTPEASPSPPPVRSVDLVFTLDETGSMAGEIDGVRRSISAFLDEFQRRGLDVRVGLVAFRDRTAGELPETVTFAGGGFTRDPLEFTNAAERLFADGGGDDLETSLEALQLAGSYPFRPEATKVILLITDAPFKDPDPVAGSSADVVASLRTRGIDQLHLAIYPEQAPRFSRLRSIPGEVFSLADASAGGRNFSRILPEVGRRIATSIRTGSAVTSRVDISPRRFGSLMLAVSLWTATLSLGLFMTLYSAQNRYLSRPALPLFPTLAGMIGSLAAGLFSGAVGQFIYGGAAMVPALVVVARIACWCLLGAMLGLGSSFVIPNLGRRPALLGGAGGGLFGAFGLLAAGGELTGRILGACSLGFFIGLGVCLAEVLVRKAWLEVAYAPNEVSLVNLGEEPVTVGGDPGHDTVYVSGVRDRACTFRVEGGQILYQDNESGRTRTLSPGDRRRLGNVTLSVHQQ